MSSTTPTCGIVCVGAKLSFFELATLGAYGAVRRDLGRRRYVRHHQGTSVAEPRRRLFACPARAVQRSDRYRPFP